MNTATNTPQITASRLVNAATLACQTNILPKDATMKGDLSAAKDMSIRLDGEYDGKIAFETGGTVHIAAGSIVKTTSVVADFIYVEGTVKGNLHARKGLELGPTAKVKGEVRYDKDIDMHPGARVAGQMIGADIDSFLETGT